MVSLIPAAHGQGFEGRIFFPTPETVAIYEFNGLPDLPDLTPLGDGTVVPDLSGNGLDATVEANGSDLIIGPGDPNFETSPGANRELKRAGNANGGARLAINDDGDAFEMAPQDDFSIELYVNREAVDDPVKWGILAGNWHSRTLLDDAVGSPDVNGAWYGYGLIRADEGATGGQWSWVLSPLLGGVDSPPALGCCNERNDYFDIPEGRHLVVLSVNRVDQTAITYLDGLEVARVVLAPEWSFTTPIGYEHARFTMFAGEDDPSRNSYRASPAGTQLDAVRVQRKAISPDEALEVWDSILAGQPHPPPPDTIRAFVAATRTTAITGQCVKLDGSGSSPGVGKTIVKFEWKVADGAFEEGTPVREVSFDAPSTDGYEVILRITNSAAETDQARVAIKVQKPSLVARILPELNGRILPGAAIHVPLGTVLTLDGTSSSFAIASDALRCPMGDGIPVEPPAITGFAWDLDNRSTTIEDTRPRFDTAPYGTPGDFKINLIVTAADGTKSPRVSLNIRVADSAGNSRVFHNTPDTVVHYEFNEFPELTDGTSLPTGAVVKDLSGSGLDATVEANDSGDLIIEQGLESLDVPAGSNREARRSGNADFRARLAINDDQDAFEMTPEDDFSVELYVNREVVNDPVKWGILAGTWHSRTLLDDAVGNPDQNGAWYGYGLIRSDETVSGAQWSWVLSPLEGGVDSPPRIGCCWENHAPFNIPEGRHYVVLSVNRINQTAITFLDGKQAGTQNLQPTWSFTTPLDYEHARFTIFAGEDDPSRDAYRPAPARTGVDALRFQRKALSLDDVGENWQNIITGKGANPEFAPRLPAAPAGLVAAAGNGEVSLDWSDSTEPDLEGYLLFRSAAGGPFDRLNQAPLTASAYRDTGLGNGAEYCYRVVAVNPAGASPPSTQACARPAAGVRFVRGDADANGAFELTDPVRLLNYLFLGQQKPECLDAADVDDNGQTDITDAIGNLNYQFLGGPPPVAPFGGCGTDPAEESPDLGCDLAPPGCR